MGPRSIKRFHRRVLDFCDPYGRRSACNFYVWWTSTGFSLRIFFFSSFSRYIEVAKITIESMWRTSRYSTVVVLLSPMVGLTPRKRTMVMILDKGKEQGLPVWRGHHFEKRCPKNTQSYLHFPVAPKRSQFSWSNGWKNKSSTYPPWIVSLLQ